MVEVFVNLLKFCGLFNILQEKYNVEREQGDLYHGCTRWVEFTKTKYFEPYEKLIPSIPDLYYVEANPDFLKIECIMNELEYVDGTLIRRRQQLEDEKTKKYRLPKGKNASDIAKKCGVSPQDVTNLIKINRIADKILDEEFSGYLQDLNCEPMRLWQKGMVFFYNDNHKK